MVWAAYARVSTRDQTLEGQIDKITKYASYRGLTFELFSEKVSSIAERDQFDQMLKRLDDFEGIIVTSLDRLGRSVQQLSNFNVTMQQRKKEFIIINQNIDTSTKEGRLFFHMLSAIAEFEREIIRERLIEGRLRTRKKGGRIRKVLPRDAILDQLNLGASVSYLSRYYHVGRSTMERRVREWFPERFERKK